MYPPSSSSSSSSSSCSSSHGSLAPNSGGGGGGGHRNLTRYGSAPSSLLTTAVDAITGRNPQFGPHHTTLVGPTHSQYFSSSDTESNKAGGGLQRSHCLNNNNIASSTSNHNHHHLMKSSTSTEGDSSSLVRHSSSPAGFLNRLASAATATASDNVTRGIAIYNSKGGSDSVRGISRLNSQLSFTKDSLSQITEESENVDDDMTTADRHRKATHSYATANFGLRSWDDTNGIMFSPSPSKRAKSINADIANGFNIIESQFQFGLPETALEMATMEKLIDIPHDSVPCKIRAKRGCATHPRSIAERERRTRISGKLKKLQDLVPNMDKQTSYADMLDLAVQHIKGLQTQVQNLHKEVENCTCGCKQNT